MQIYEQAPSSFSVLGLNVIFPTLPRGSTSPRLKIPVFHDEKNVYGSMGNPQGASGFMGNVTRTVAGVTGTP